MFLVGLELDTRRCCATRAHATRRHLARQHRRAVPARRGAGAAALSARCRPATCRSRCSRCSCGVAMSVTAFPVLARILTDRGMHRVAAGRHRADLRRGRRRDRVVPAGVRGRRRPGARRRRAADRGPRALGYIAVMFLAVRPLLRRLVAGSSGQEALDQGRDGRRLRRRCCCRRWRPSRSASTRSSARSCSARSSRTTRAWRAS